MIGVSAESMLVISLASRRQNNNSRWRIVSLCSGDTLVFDATNSTELLPVYRYMTAPYTAVEASQNPYSKQGCMLPAETKGATITIPWNLDTTPFHFNSNSCDNGSSQSILDRHCSWKISLMLLPQEIKIPMGREATPTMLHFVGFSSWRNLAMFVKLNSRLSDSTLFPEPSGHLLHNYQ